MLATTYGSCCVVAILSCWYHVLIPSEWCPPSAVWAVQGWTNGPWQSHAFTFHQLPSPNSNCLQICCSCCSCGVLLLRAVPRISGQLQQHVCQSVFCMVVLLPFGHVLNRHVVSTSTLDQSSPVAAACRS
eukprot:GHUV01009078.1.p3 GENE.GHUV01009078.1~~GHUV01009078.1.p3  ORF type:complete len:130 (+),score=23.18 GHUV01009078.1:1975-2364(+)